MVASEVGTNSSNDEMKKQINQLLKGNTKTDLMKLCKERNLSCKGTKFDLGMQILGFHSNVFNKDSNKSTSFQQPNEPIIIQKNNYGHYVHDSTNLVFDPMSRLVIGKQNLEGKISDLTRNDIYTCQQFKFQYLLPETLDDDIEQSSSLSARFYNKSEFDDDDAFFSNDDD